MKSFREFIQIWREKCAFFSRVLVHAMGTHKDIADKWGRLKSKLNSDRFGVKESFEAELANL